MTTLTNQENITDSVYNSNVTVENKDTSTNEVQVKHSKIHTFLANISNKLGLSNAIYFK